MYMIRNKADLKNENNGLHEDTYVVLNTDATPVTLHERIMNLKDATLFVNSLKCVYAPSAYNQEDSLLFKRSFLERGGFRYSA